MLAPPLKVALRARAATADWALHLPWVLLALRAAPHDESGLSPAEAIFGVPVTLPGQFLEASDCPPPSLMFLREVWSTLGCQRPHHIPPPQPAELPADLLQAEMVFVQNDTKLLLLSPLYSGPYRVLERSLRFCKLQIVFAERSEIIKNRPKRICCPPFRYSSP
jgi:hypothetical protein